MNVKASQAADFLIAGAGIVGTSVAIALKRRYPEARIYVLDKEAVGFAHSSGRNSGVIHAGFYYAPGSLKAKMTANGNLRLTAYCEERKIPLNRCGKLVVARHEEDHAQLNLLLERGRKNGSRVELLTADQARQIEPRAKTYLHALWSPETKVADPIAVLQSLQVDARDAGIIFEFGNAVKDCSGGKIHTQTGERSIGFFINSAGLQAEQIAHQFGFAADYRSLPFKGLYLYSSKAAPSFRTNIYPVPDLKYPFLGVHVTLTLDGRSKLGPTAMPALWREQYGGFEGFSAFEAAQITFRHGRFLYNNGTHFFKMAIEEFRKYQRAFMVRRAGELANGITIKDFSTWGRPGIRSQLVNLKTRKLEMDFVLEGDRRSLHILNAVSPGWTCSMPFADFVCDQVERSASGTGLVSLRESEL